jgi:NADPH-dependent 2,4-dienoyl-CoA reductase/sulfur reductase-like enzyme
LTTVPCGNAVETVAFKQYIYQARYTVDGPGALLIYCDPTDVIMKKQELNVGIVGGGIGGVMAAIAIARAGGNVTVLEAASQLGEIGAGLQMVGSAELTTTFANRLIVRRHRMYPVS